MALKTNNGPLVNSNSNQSPTMSPQYSNNQPGSSSSNSNRLQFNRLATERKTVHVMNSNLNKDIMSGKRQQQMLGQFNSNNNHQHHQSAAYAPSNATGAGHTLNGSATHHNNANTLHNYNDLGGLGNQSSLDYTMSGRGQNASSFLQKLSSKFIRR